MTLNPKNTISYYYFKSQKYLHSKYLKFENSYTLICINNLLYNETCRIVARFKDFLIYDDSTEFLKKFVKRSEQKSQMEKIVNFYAKYSKVFPNYMILPENVHLYRNLRKKQKMIDKLNEIKREEEENRQHLKIFSLDKLYPKDQNIIFNSKIQESIERYTPTNFNQLSYIEKNKNNEKSTINISLNSKLDITEINNINDSSLLSIVEILNPGILKKNKKIKKLQETPIKSKKSREKFENTENFVNNLNNKKFISHFQEIKKNNIKKEDISINKTINSNLINNSNIIHIKNYNSKISSSKISINISKNNINSSNNNIIINNQKNLKKNRILHKKSNSNNINFNNYINKKPRIIPTQKSNVKIKKQDSNQIENKSKTNFIAQKKLIFYVTTEKIKSHMKPIYNYQGKIKSYNSKKNVSKQTPSPNNLNPNILKNLVNNKKYFHHQKNTSEKNAYKIMPLKQFRDNYQKYLNENKRGHSSFDLQNKFRLFNKYLTLNNVNSNNITTDKNIQISTSSNRIQGNKKDLNYLKIGVNSAKKKKILINNVKTPLKSLGFKANNPKKFTNTKEVPKDKIKTFLNKLIHENKINKNKIKYIKIK